MFGTLDDDDAQFYHEHIERLEQGTTTLTQLMKQQLVIVKSVLGTFNETLTDAEYNEIKMAEGLNQLQRHVHTLGTQLENTTYLLSLKIAIESHIAKALDASQAVQQTLDLLVESLAKAKEGTLAPRVMSPVLLLNTLKNGISSFPLDTTFPFPLSKDYLFLLYQLSDVCVYTYKKRLGYVISVPSVNKRSFTVWRMVPLPLPVDQDHFVYIDVRDAVVCVDQAKQYYFSMREEELSTCKLGEPGHYVCTHQHTLLSTMNSKSCAVALIKKKDNLPPVCDTRVTKLSHTVWTQLLNNSWIFYAPQVAVVTILCHDNNPVDIHLQGIGKLQLHPGCTGYSPNTLLYGNTAVGNTSLPLEGDFLLQLEFNDVCCEELRVKLHSYPASVDIAYQKTTSHLEDLRSASTKVSELIRKVDEQDWKNHYVNHHNTYSV